jgi:1-phosphofructokinase
MVQSLGADPMLCAAVGGESGVALRSIIAADGIASALAETDRPNAVVIDDRRGERVEVARTAVPPFGRHEVDEIYSAVVGSAMQAGVCVIAGTQLASSLSDDTFRRLVGDLRANGVTVVADLCGGPLRGALDGGADIVKISHEELLRDGWAERDSVQGSLAGIAGLRRLGADAVVVSRSYRTTVAGFGDRFVEVRAPRLEAIDARGGGDSMTAALAVSTARGDSFVDALRLAAAAGALNVTRHGLGTGRQEAIEELAARVEVRDVATNSRTDDGARPLEQLTRRELYQLAQLAGVDGRSKMTRAELLEALG